MDTRRRLFICAGTQKTAVSPYAAPSRQTDWSGLPPCYTFVGDGEPFYTETLEYVNNLKNEGWEIKFNDLNIGARKLWEALTAKYDPIIHHLDDSETVLEFNNIQIKPDLPL